MNQTFTLYDNEKKQIVDDEITIIQFIDFYLSDIEDLDSHPEKHRRKCFLMKLNHLARKKEFVFRNFEFSKN